MTIDLWSSLPDRVEWGRNLLSDPRFIEVIGVLVNGCGMPMLKSVDSAALEAAEICGWRRCVDFLLRIGDGLETETAAPEVTYGVEAGMNAPEENIFASPEKDNA